MRKISNTCCPGILKAVLFVLTGLFMHVRGYTQTPGGVAGPTTWFKANSTTAGTILPDNNNNTAVSDWKSETGPLTLSQATASSRPLFQAITTSSGNFNFNPFIKFITANSTTLSSGSTSPDVLGTAGTAFWVVNTFPGASTNPTAFTYMSSSNYRYQVKPGFRMQTGNNGSGYTADFYVPLLPQTAPVESGYILVSKGTGSVFRGRNNADSVPLTNQNDPVYFPAVNSGMFLGSNGGASELYNGGIAEIVTYSTTLADADINKVESYLALKYGVTLSQNSAYGPAHSNYTASDGTVFWTAAAHTGYNKNITGIGRDDASSLLQKQSKSVHDSSLVYIYNDNTGGTFPAMNTGNSSSIVADKSFLLFGDNGLDRNLAVCIFNGKMVRMNRVWKVQKTGAINTVTIAVDQADVSANVKKLLVSADPLFPQAATTIYDLQQASGKLYTALTLNNNEYFTFASDSLIVQIAITNPSCSAPNSGSAASTVTGGVNPYTYSWNSSPVQTTATATGLSGGNYTLTVTHAGCSATYPITLVAPPAPVISVSASSTELCEGESVTLTASVVSGTINTWSWAPGGQTVNPLTLTLTDTTLFTVTGTDNNGCTATASITVNVKPKPTSSFTVSPATVCEGVEQTVTFIGTASASAIYNWNFNGASVQSGSGAGPYTLLFTAAGNYTIQLDVTDNGCSSITASQPVTIVALPLASFTSGPAVNTEIQLAQANFSFSNTSQNATTYSWDFGDAGSSTQTNPTHKYILPGNYEVTLYAENSAGCRDTFSLKYYIVIPDKELIIPNAFSPNSDGINDQWVIEGLNGYPDCRVEIFNRWGQSVFSSKGYSPWNGKYKGKDMPVGTYYYIISTSLKIYKGWVVLLK
jgi:gliding motility-associated-like protein